MWRIGSSAARRAALRSSRPTSVSPPVDVYFPEEAPPPLGTVEAGSPLSKILLGLPGYCSVQADLGGRRRELTPLPGGGMMRLKRGGLWHGKVDQGAYS